MTMPSSGQISMGQINNELGRATSAQIGLDQAENGAYGALAPYSPSRPSGGNPAAMSEWWGYNGAAFPYYMKAYVSSQSNCGYTMRLWSLSPSGWSYVTDCYSPGCNSYGFCGVLWSLPGGSTRQFGWTNLSNQNVRWGGSLFDQNACGYVDPNSQCGTNNALGVGGISSNWDIGFVVSGCGNSLC
jgi:hypothetical protein